MPLFDDPLTLTLKPARKPGRVLVKRGSEVIARLSDKSVAELGLRQDMPCDDELAAQITQTGHVDNAMQDAMRAISRRAMASGQLDRKLADKGHAPEPRAAAIARLTELGLINDDEVARQIIRETQRQRPAGPRLLKQKLRQKGVTGQAADQAIEELKPDHDEAVDQAHRLAEKKWRTDARVEPMKRRQRVYALLGRRGFDRDVIDAALQRLRQQDDLE